MAQSFSASVGAWAAKSREMLTAVHREAAERVISIAQTPVGQGGNLPIATGFLRASLVVTLGEALPAVRSNPNPNAPKGSLDTFNPSDMTLTLANADIATPILAVWTASYSRYVEYGGENRIGRRFVGLAAQQWAQVVAGVVQDVKARYGG